MNIYFDGACEPFNPGGVATWGFTVFDQENKLIQEDCGVVGKPNTPQATNNVAEYSAIIEALKYCADHKLTNVTIHGDSQLVINQLNREWKVKSDNIKPLYNKAIKLVDQINPILKWVRREYNEIADALSKKAYVDYLKDNQPLTLPFGKYKGKTVNEIAKINKGYLQWLLKQANIRQELKDYIENILIGKFTGKADIRTLKKEDN